MGRQLYNLHRRHPQSPRPDVRADDGGGFDDEGRRGGAAAVLNGDEGREPRGEGLGLGGAGGMQDGQPLRRAEGLG